MTDWSTSERASDRQNIPRDASIDQQTKDFQFARIARFSLFAQDKLLATVLQKILRVTKLSSAADLPVIEFS